MSHSPPPKSERRSNLPSLPKELSEALDRVRHEPTNWEAWDALVELSQELDRPEETAALFGESLTEKLSALDLEELGRRAADYSEEWFEEPEPTQKVLHTVLQLDPNQGWAFERLTVLLTSTSRWVELLRVYDGAIANASGEGKENLLEEAARVARDFAGEVERGTDYLIDLLLVRVTDDQLATTLERRLEEQHRDSDLIKIWRARLPAVSPDARLKLRAQIASRYLAPLRRFEDALAVMRDLLATKEGTSDAEGLLLRLASIGDAPKEFRRAALDELSALYQRADEKEKCARIIREILVLGAEAEEQCALHRHAFELLRATGLAEEALVHGTLLVQRWPELADVRASVRELAVFISSLDRFADALVQGARDSADPALAVELRIEAARVYQLELGDADAAKSLYQKIAGDKEASSAARLLACQELTLLLTEAGERPVLLEVWVQRAELEPKALDQKLCYGAGATLAEEIDDLDRALSLWGTRLRLDPTDIEALGHRIDLFARLGRAQGLVETLLDRAKIHGDAELERQDLVRAADVYAEQLSDVPAAIKLYRDIEKKYSRTQDSLDALLRLSARAGRHEDVLELLLEECSVSRAPERHAEYHEQAGETLRLHLQRHGESITEYEKCLALEPGREVAKVGLRSLLVVPDCAHRASEALASALLRTGETAEVVALLETRLRAAPSDDGRTEILLATAGYAEGLGDLSAALSAVARAFSLSPVARTEAEMHRLAEAVGDFSLVVAAYGKALERTSGDRAQLLWLERGRVLEGRLGDRASAARAYSESLLLKPSDKGALALLLAAALASRLPSAAAKGYFDFVEAEGSVSETELSNFANECRLADVWDDALISFEAELKARAELPAESRHVLTRSLALWHRDERQDADSAVRILEAFSTEAPHVDTLTILSDLLRVKRGPRLVTALVALSKATKDDLALLEEAADVALEIGAEKEVLVPILENGIALSFARFASTEWASDGERASSFFEKRASVFAEAGQTKEEVDLLELASALPFAAEAKTSLLLRAAERAVGLESDARATSLLERVLERDAENAAAIQLLSSLHERAGRLDKLSALRRRELACAPPLERKLFLRLDLSRVLGILSEDGTERVALLKKNIEEAPGDEPSLAALIALYTEQEKFSELVDELEDQAELLRAKERTRAASYFELAGSLAETELGDLERLGANYKKAVELRPTEVALDRLATLAEARGDLALAVRYLTERLRLSPAAGGSQKARDDRRRTTAVLAGLRLRLGEKNEARVLLEAEIRLDEEDNTARGMLADLYADLGQWEELFGLLCAGVAFAEGDSERVLILRNAAQVARRHLGRLDDAIPLLRDAVELDLEDKSLRLVLADTLRAAGALDEAKAELLPLLEEFGRRRTREKALIHLQLARIAQGKNELEEALEQAEAAAKIERTDPAILMMVGRLARKSGQLARAEQAYRTLLLIVSRGGVKASDEPFEETVGESSILFELSRIAEDEGQNERAAELLDSALEVATRDPEEALRLELELAESGQTQLLLDSLDARLQSAEGELAARLLTTKAVVLAKHDRLDEALQARIRAIGLSPSDLKQIDVAWKLAEELDSLEPLISQLARVAEGLSGQPEPAFEIWLKLAGAVEDFDPLRAKNYLEAAQRLGIRATTVFVPLERLLVKLGDQAGLIACLSRFVETEDASRPPSLLAEALYRLGEHFAAVGDLAGASVNLERAFGIEPLPARVIAALEGLVQRTRVPKPVFALFMDAARRVGPPSTLLLAIRRTAEVTTDGELALEGVELARTLGDRAAKVELLTRAIELHRESAELSKVRDALVERATLAIEDHEATLAALLLREASNLFEGPEKVLLEIRYAELASGSLGNAELAIATYEKLLSEGNAERRVFVPLLDLYRRTGKIAAIEAKLVELDGLVGAQDRGFLRLERARILAAAERSEEAEALLRETLLEEPTLYVVGAELVALLTRTERSSEARDLLNELWDAARRRGDGEQVGLYGLLFAELFAREERSEAVSILSAGLSYTTGQRPVLETLLSLYTDEDDQADRADAMEQLLGLESGMLAKGLALQLCGIREALGDTYGALRALELGVKASPSDFDLSEALVQKLREEDDSARLAEILLEQAKFLEDPEFSAERFREAAQIFEDRLGEPARAASAFYLAFERDSTDTGSLAHAVEIWTRLGERDEARSRLTEALKSADDMNQGDLLEARAGLLLREFAENLDDLRLADADIVAALGSLVSEEQASRLSELRVEALRRLAVVEGSHGNRDAERAAVIELASLEERIGEGSAALETLASWLRGDEADREVAEMVAQKARKAGDFELCLFALDCLVRSTSGEEKTRAVLSLSDAAIRAGSPEVAQAAIAEACAANPASSELRVSRRRLFEAAGQLAELGEALVADADAMADGEEKYSALLEGGTLLLEAGSPLRAAEVLESARATAKDPYVVAAKLSDCYVKLGEIERAKALLEGSIEAHGKRKSPELAVLQQALAGVARANGDVEGMYAWLEAALITDRNNLDVAIELAVRSQEDGRYESAIKALQMITLSKGGGSMSKAEAFYRQAEISERLGDAKKALLLARRAMTTDDGFPAAQALINRLGG